MNKEELLRSNAVETLEIINKGISKLNSIMEELTNIGYGYEMELENIDCSTLELKKQCYKLSVILTKDISNEK